MNKDGILIMDGYNFYPLAHSDNNGEVITDTYSRKEINEFILKPAYWREVDPGSEGESGDKYYSYLLSSVYPDSDYPELVNVKITDNPMWDVKVSPISETVSPSTYKEQIKYRAWITTLNTFNGGFEIYAMKAPDKEVTIITIGLRLHPEE